MNIAEEAVIGAAVTLDGAWTPNMVELQPGDFGTLQGAEMWEAIRAVRDRGEPTDIVHCYREIRKTSGVETGIRMTELAEWCPTVANVDHWAGLVIDDSRKRSAARAAQLALDVAQGTDSAEDTLEAIREAMRHIRPAASVAGPRLAQKALGGVMRNLEAECADPNHARICGTGIPDLDGLFEMRAAHLTVLAGRPGMGKSALVGNIATHAALEGDTGSVVVFSLEMDEESLIRRAIMAEARLSVPIVYGLKAGKAPQIAAATNRIHTSRLYIDDRAGMSVEQMSAALHGIPDVRLVVVDYLQLAKMTSKLERQDLRVGRVTKDLKKMAKDHRTHVMALSQLNRAVEGRAGQRPVLSDLRDSGQIEEDADSVLFIHREGYYSEDADPEKAEIIIAKQRHGRQGVVHVRWLATAQRFLPL